MSGLMVTLGMVLGQQLPSNAAPPPPAWTPADMPGLLAWWDASDSGTVGEGATGRMAQISDKSGNNNHYTQSNTANQPFINSRLINGRKVLDFQAGQAMQAASGLFNIGNTANDVYIFTIVTKDVASGAGRYMFSTQLQTILEMNHIARMNSANVTITAPIDTVPEQSRFIALMRTNGGVDLAETVDGGALASGAGSQFGTLSYLTWGAGGNQGGYYSHYDGTFNESWIASVPQGTMPQAQLNSAAAYSKSKWGSV